MLHSILNIILYISGKLSALLTALCTHWSLYALIGLFTTRRFPAAKRQHRLAIVVAARNEASVIGNLLESIRRQDYPAELVKSKFLKLDHSHIEFVLDCMKQNTSKIRNIKQYLRAVLFNAPSTIDNYYTALVAHDMAAGYFKKG